MVEFRGVKLDYAEARKQSETPASGMDIGVNVDGLKISGEDLLIEFTYLVKYGGGLGYLKMHGLVYAKDEPKALKQIEAGWKKEKKLPADVAQQLLNVINFSAGVNGVFVARAINLPPPLMPPQVQLTNLVSATPKKKG
jgi:hypothetical protein